MEIRNQLVDRLMKAGAFWSYDRASVRHSITDRQLIEETLIRLDIDDIMRKIKKVWLETMVIQGDYYYSLNRFFAWYYFSIRYPDRYLKSMQTRHLSKFTA